MIPPIREIVEKLKRHPFDAFAQVGQVLEVQDAVINQLFGEIDKRRFVAEPWAGVREALEGLRLELAAFASFHRQLVQHVTQPKKRRKKR